MGVLAEFDQYAFDASKYLSVTAYPEFVHLCDVTDSSTVKRWNYENVNEQLMFSDHNSWVYFIVVDHDEIYKTGETGNVLGLKGKTKRCFMKTGTQSRIGRYMANGETDAYIREELQPLIDAGHTVSFYVKQCPKVQVATVQGGVQTNTMLTSHKQEEFDYMDLMVQAAGRLPKLNKARK